MKNLYVICRNALKFHTKNRFERLYQNQINILTLHAEMLLKVLDKNLYDKCRNALKICIKKSDKYLYVTFKNVFINHNQIIYKHGIFHAEMHRVKRDEKS